MKVVQCFSFGNFMAREFYPKRNSWWRHCKQRRCRSCQNEFILCKLAFHRGLKAVTASLNRSFSSEQNHRIKKLNPDARARFERGRYITILTSINNMPKTQTKISWKSRAREYKIPLHQVLSVIPWLCRWKPCRARLYYFVTLVRDVLLMAQLVASTLVSG